jgi:hypothetical protein
MEDEASQTPTPETPIPDEPAPAPAAAAPAEPEATLAQLAEKSALGRLAPAEEERAAALVRAGLLGKKDAQAETAALLPRLGWSAAVKGVTSAWPEMKATARTALLKALAATGDEAGRRLRFSLARGLAGLPDLPTAMKLAAGAAQEMLATETGAPAPRDAQNFAAVLLGKGRPWIVHLSLAEAKPAEAEALAAAAVRVAFGAKESPVTQLGVLAWLGGAGRLETLDPGLLAVITAGVAQWKPKWAAAARQEIPNLPEAIAAALPAEPPPAQDGLPAELTGGEVDPAPSEGADGAPAAEAAPKKERPVYISKTVPPREPRSEREPREPKGPPARSAAFNASEALRQLDAHIAFLKGELKTAEQKLRERPAKKREAKADTPIIPGEPTPDELARINVQLEARVTELQARLAELAADAEARAVSAGAFAATPEMNPDAQLRTLLGLKLAEHYADFEALEKEDRDLVIPAHYRTVLAEVFAILQAEGIPLVSASDT